MLRVLSWLGVILLCFVAGYLGTSWVMDALNEKLLLKPENRVENQSDLAKLNAAVERDREAAAARSGNVQQVSLKLYSVKDGRIAEPVRKSFVSRLKEDNMAEAVKSVLALSGVPGADKVSVLHVFRSAETAYLDLSSAFVSALASIGQRESLLLLTAIVRTMEENFEPVVQVRFLIDSRSPSPGACRARRCYSPRSPRRLPRSCRRRRATRTPTRWSPRPSPSRGVSSEASLVVSC